MRGGATANDRIARADIATRRNAAVDREKLSFRLRFRKEQKQRGKREAEPFHHVAPLARRNHVFVEMQVYRNEPSNSL